MAFGIHINILTLLYPSALYWYCPVSALYLHVYLLLVSSPQIRIIGKIRVELNGEELCTQHMPLLGCSAPVGSRTLQIRGKDDGLHARRRARGGAGRGDSPHHGLGKAGAQEKRAAERFRHGRRGVARKVTCPSVLIIVVLYDLYDASCVYRMWHRVPL